MGNLNLKNWKITALFRARADGRKRGENSPFFLTWRARLEKGCSRGIRVFVHGEGCLFFEGMIERRFHDLLRAKLVLMIILLACS
jgi:hypothetical protein